MNGHDRGWCNQLLNQFMKWPITTRFRFAVDVRHAPGYLSVISRPMDLGLVRRKLMDSEYSSVQDFIGDIALIFDNAKRFNGPTSMYAVMGDDIMTAVNQREGLVRRRGMIPIVGRGDP
jgi:hypothetical protein